MQRSITNMKSIFLIVALTVAASSVLDLSFAQTNQSIPDDELLIGKADQFSAVVDRAVDCLKRGDATCFRSMLSPNTIKSETRGTGTIDAIIQTRFIPFFKECARLTDTVTTLPTRDSDNDFGLAFFRTCETPSEREAPFVIYIIKKGESFVVGNLLLNKTLVDVQGKVPAGS